KGIATRAASGQVLNSIAETMPELWGGSADLAGSNNTLIKGEPSFLPAHRSTAAFSGHEYGRNIHCGGREVSAGLIGNGLALPGHAVPTLDRDKYAPAAQAARGGYVLTDTGDRPEVAIIASGSEVAIALEAAHTLHESGTAARVISMPCQEWFEAQPEEY